MCIRDRFITNECVILRCVTADSAWVVEYDGRIKCQSVIQGAFTCTATSAQQLTFTSSEQKINVGNVSVAASEYIYYARRAGNITITVSVDFISTTAGTIYLWPVIRLNGGSSGLQANIYGGTRSGGSNCHASTQCLTMAAGGYLDITLEQNDSTSEAIGYHITCLEAL